MSLKVKDILADLLKVDFLINFWIFLKKYRKRILRI